MENGQELQKHINKETEKNIEKLYDHAEVANREMGAVKTDMEWVKKNLKKLDNRTWWILGTIILGIIVQILLNI